MKQLTCSLFLIYCFMLFSCQTERPVKQELQQKFQTLTGLTLSPTLAIYQIREADKDYETEYSLYWRYWLENQLSGVPGLTLLHRGEDLKFLLAEQKLLLGGITQESEQSIRAGELLSARYILNATLHRKSAQPEMQYRVLDSTTGQVILSDQLPLPRDQEQKALQADLSPFPARSHQLRIEAHSRSLEGIIRNQLNRSRNIRLFCAVISSQVQKNPWESWVEHKLISYLVQSGIRYQPNLVSDQAAFADRQSVYLSLETPLYGKDPYLVLFIHSRDEKSAIRIQWELVFFGKDNRSLFQDSILLEK